jgi:hypothetical protein
MTALLRKYGLFYLTSTGAFFFLCAYSLAADAPNYPFLPALFMPVYLSAAMAMSEGMSDDPLMGVLPVTPAEIMTVKFGLAFVFVAIGWINMGLFTMLQGLEPQLAAQVMKLNTIAGIDTLLLAAAFQLGIHFFGHSVFHKVIIGFCVAGGIFGIVFFIGLAESGHNHPGEFPLLPFLEALPIILLIAGCAAAAAVYVLVLRRGPWVATSGMGN